MSENELTKPGVFIIESLTIQNEEDERYEGQLIAQILSLNQIDSQYYYIRTKKELAHVLGLFYNSEYRYLHLSCHGDTENVHLTLDSIDYEELGEMLEANLLKKRLFLSACEATNERLVEEIIPRSGCYSVIGPVNTIQFRDSAITWAGFYYLMFRQNRKSMFRKDLIKGLQKTVNAFEQPMNYFSISSKRKKGYKKLVIEVQQTKLATSEEIY
jgi:hypothetical protein